MPGSESITSESTLAPVGPGPAGCQRTVEDVVQPTLRKAEEKLRTVRRRLRMHRWAMWGAAAVLVIVGAFASLVAIATKGKQKAAFIAILVMGGVAFFVGLCLAGVRRSDEPETSWLRMLELDDYVFDLREFVRNHGHRAWSEFGEEVQVGVISKERRLQKIMDSSMVGLRLLSLDNDKRLGLI